MKDLLSNSGRRVIIMLAIAAGISILSLISGPASAQESGNTAPRPTPTPRPTATPIDDDDPIVVETELVNLNVRVVDRNNRPINNLPQTEFSIFEDNVAQTIEFFSRSEVPTNYSLVIDNSGSLRSQINEVIEAGKIIVDTNRDGDKTSVIRFVDSQNIEIVQDFSTDKEEVKESLETQLFIEGGRTAIIDAVYLAIQNVSDYERGADDHRKRRAIVLVSDGEDVNSVYSQKQLVDLLKESDVQIYTVGFVRDLSDRGGFFSKSSQSKAKSFLEDLALQTGGKAYFPNSVSELPTIARDIASEMRMQYSIGYIPTNNRDDGTYRNIKVLIKDGPNKEKRIAVTRAGRTAEGRGGQPTLQRSN